MGNTILFNTAGSIALAVNCELYGPDAGRFVTSPSDRAVLINKEVFIRVGDAVLVIDSDDVLLGESDLDTGSAFDPSTAYYLFACHPLDGTLTPAFRISKNATYPAGGWSAVNSRLVGGFSTDGAGDIDAATLWDLRSVMWEGFASENHAPAHARGAPDEIDGDTLDIDYPPNHYTPDSGAPGAGSTAHLAAHLAGIDTALAQAGGAVAYGVRWNAATDVMTPGTIRNDRFVPGDYTQMPVHDRCGLRCVTGAAAAVQYYLHPDDSTKKMDGSAADLDGSDGQVMSEFQQFHYIRKNDGDYRYLLVGERPFRLTLADDSLVSSRVHEWFYEGAALPAEKRYLGAFEGVLWDASASAYANGTGAALYASGDKLHSVYGFVPMTCMGLSEVRAAAAADAGYHALGFRALEALKLLFVTKYKTLNAQAALPGYTEAAAWDFSRVCKTGITATLGNHDGSVQWEDAPSALRCATDMTGYTVANAFLGVENLFGHLYKWMDGANIYFDANPLTDASLWLCDDPALWVSDAGTNYTDTGFSLPLAAGYITDMIDGMMLPSEASGGSSASYLCDYYHIFALTGWQHCIVGGFLAAPGSAGMSAAMLYSPAGTFRDASLGGRVAA
jgi:hypothetical protein